MVTQRWLGQASTASSSKALAAGPVDMEFQGITYTVVLKGRGGKAEQLHILQGISGACRSGRVLAIMGASGAGKTTLLDILAGNLFGGGQVDGDIRANGAPLLPADQQRVSCYVQQRDVLLASSTVRESVALSAMLKLPYSLSVAQKMERVDQILQELDLAACQHTLIGDEMLQLRGISGGQKRRVSLAMELVKDPRLLFLDEPTSGLDSEMAVSVMELLVRLARKGRTVTVTIHQPNSIIAALFDDYMLLGKGRLIYFGAWEEAVDFFAGAGFPCPMYQNPTDFFIHILRDPGTIDTLAAHFQKRLEASPPAAPDLEARPQPAVAPAVAAAAAVPAIGEAGLDGMEKGQAVQPAAGGAAAADAAHKVEPPAPFHYQVWVLMGRMCRMWWRNPAMLAAEFAQYLFMALFVGLVYFQVSDSIYTGANDRAASLWFAIAVLSFTPSYTAVTMWDKERLLLRRESGSGMYSVASWFAAKTLTVAPVQVAQVTIFCLICYWMVGYVGGRADLFFIYWGAYTMFQLTSESIGLLCAALTKNSTGAVLALTFVLLFLLSFSGFLISDVPVYFQWITKISYLTYAYAAVMVSQFENTTFYGPMGHAYPGSDRIPPSVDNGLSPGVNLAVLGGIMVGTRCLAYVAIELAARFKLL